MDCITKKALGNGSPKPNMFRIFRRSPSPPPLPPKPSAPPYYDHPPCKWKPWNNQPVARDELEYYGPAVSYHEYPLQVENYRKAAFSVPSSPVFGYNGRRPVQVVFGFTQPNEGSGFRRVSPFS